MWQQRACRGKCWDAIFLIFPSIYSFHTCYSMLFGFVHSRRVPFFCRTNPLKVNLNSSIIYIIDKVATAMNGLPERIRNVLFNNMETTHK